MRTLIIRNTKLYFRDKTNIFFSVLSVLLIVALFALFLGGIGDWGTDEIRNTWLMAGVLAVASITKSLGAFDIVVMDRANKIVKGFYASPVSRMEITAAYIISPFIASVLMSLVTAVAFGAYIVFSGGQLPYAAGMLQLFGVILLSNLTGTAMLCFMVSFIKSAAVYSTAGTILGTLSGFLMGVYVPIGNLPNIVQNAIVFFPPFHSAMLYRQILMERPLADVPYFVDTRHIQELLGATRSLGGMEITPLISVLVLVVSAAVFFALAAMRMRKTEF